MTQRTPRYLTGHRVELKPGFFHSWEEYPVIESEIMPGVLRQSVANENLMLTRAEYLPGCGVPIHSHEAQQVIVVLEGTLSATVGEDSRDLRAGEFVFVPSGVPHGFHSREGCAFLEAATPTRVEYLVGYIAPVHQVLNRREEKADSGAG